MSEPIFRPARRDDIRAIVDMLADDTLGQAREDVSEPLNPAYLDAFDAIEANPNELLAVAEVDGTVVGCLQLTFLPGLARKGLWRGQIEGVRVASSMRGSGLGRKMMVWALEECRKRKCGLVQLTSDKSRTDAHRFYENLGFELSHVGMKIMLE